MTLAAELLSEVGRQIGRPSLLQLGQELRRQIHSSGHLGPPRRLLLAALAQAKRQAGKRRKGTGTSKADAACVAALQQQTVALRKAQAARVAAGARVEEQNAAAVRLDAQFRDVQGASLAADEEAEDAAERSEWFAAALRQQEQELGRIASLLDRVTGDVLFASPGKAETTLHLHSALLAATSRCKDLQADASGSALAAALRSLADLSAGASKQLAAVVAQMEEARQAQASNIERAEAQKRSADASLTAAERSLRAATSHCHAHSQPAGVVSQAVERGALLLALKLHGI